jgi:hypothetical protein
MVQLIIDRLELGLNIGEVHDPTDGLLHGATQVEDGFEGMTVQAATLVAFRHMWQPVRRFESEFLENVHKST